MSRPERLPNGSLVFTGVEDVCDRFLTRCAEPAHITEDEFAAYAVECFHNTLALLYGREGMEYILKHQELHY